MKNSFVGPTPNPLCVWPHGDFGRWAISFTTSWYLFYDWWYFLCHFCVLLYMHVFKCAAVAWVCGSRYFRGIILPYVVLCLMCFCCVQMLVMEVCANGVVVSSKDILSPLFHEIHIPFLCYYLHLWVSVVKNKQFCYTNLVSPARYTVEPG
jgi:hypothetical protein